VCSRSPAGDSKRHVLTQHQARIGEKSTTACAAQASECCRMSYSTVLLICAETSALLISKRTRRRGIT
jgi:hypothetical protein